MYTKILLAIDASGTAQHAAEHAMALARKLQASLRIVCVVDSASLAGVLPGMVRLMSDDARLLLDDWMNRAAQFGIDVSTAMLETAPGSMRVADTLCIEAQRWGAQLVVLGGHGRSGPGNLLLGSVAEAVARGCHCAVLLVHPGDPRPA